MTNNKYKKRKNPLLVLALVSIIGITLSMWVYVHIQRWSKTTEMESKSVPAETRTPFTSTSPSTKIRIPILIYHYVEYVKDPGDTIRQSLNIQPRTFDAQIQTLVDAGYTFLTMSDLADAMDGAKPLPEKPVLITFDDGHWDIATDVLPILTKYNVQATAFLISGFIGRSDFLSHDQLKQVIQNGLIEIGSHTVHHTALAHAEPSVVSSEVIKSKQDLERDYGIRVVSFAYPDGSFDTQAVKAVRNAGYKIAVSTNPGVMQSLSNRYFLDRIRPGGQTGEALLTFLKNDTFKKW